MQTRVHAEMNAIIQAAIHGVSTKGAELYCTHQPCVLCAKILINADIKKVVFCESYPDKSAIKFFKDAGVVIRQHKTTCDIQNAKKST